MKVWLDADEWYPVYSIATEPDDYGDAVEVDEAAVERWREAEAAFTQAQSEIAAALTAAVAASR